MQHSGAHHAHSAHASTHASAAPHALTCHGIQQTSFAENSGLVLHLCEGVLYAADRGRATAAVLDVGVQCFWSTERGARVFVTLEYYTPCAAPFATLWCAAATAIATAANTSTASGVTGTADVLEQFDLRLRT